MTTFGLVHGGGHGAWCWDLLTPELQARGHDAVAMDVAIDRADLTLERAAGTVAAALAGHPGHVLVGHSLAGSYLPLAAARSGARMMIFLCAQIPAEGRSRMQMQAAEPGSVLTDRADFDWDDEGRMVIPPDVARRRFFGDCDDDVAAWAIARLRPQALCALFDEPLPMGCWPDIPSAYILGRDDASVSADWARVAAREHLGVQAIELESAHSPFLSQPAVLADVLANLATR